MVIWPARTHAEGTSTTGVYASRTISDPSATRYAVSVWGPAGNARSPVAVIMSPRVMATAPTPLGVPVMRRDSVPVAALTGQAAPLAPPMPPDTPPMPEPPRPFAGDLLPAPQPARATITPRTTHP